MSNLSRPPQNNFSKEKLDVSETGIKEQLERDEFDSFWPCKKLIYEILLRIASNKYIETRVLKKLFCSSSFVADFLPLFKTSKTAELEYLTKILYTLYEKVSDQKLDDLLKLFSFFQQNAFHEIFNTHFNDCFYAMIYENEEYHGIAHLLHIHYVIMNDQSVSRKKDQLAFFKKILVPLHKVR